jgi:hypothetical protein
VLLPGELLPLHVFEPRYRALTRDALAAERVMGIVAIRPGHEEEAPGAPPLEPIGCLGFVVDHRELEDGRYLLWLVGLQPFRIERELEVDTPYRAVKVSYLERDSSADELARVSPLRRELRGLIPDLLKVDDDARPSLREQLDAATDSQLVAIACQALELAPTRKQELLESSSLTGRYSLLFEDLYARSELDQAPAGVGPRTLN